MKGITVAELIEQLKELPQDMVVMQEEVSDSGWREEVPVQRAKVSPMWESQAYFEWSRQRPQPPVTNKTHCVTFE
jgi:hypothetical protein